MERKIIVVGDSPACGGEVLPFEAHPPSYIMGHRIALIGGRVFCAGCNSVGHIAKAGGPYRMGFCDAEQAPEGDVVVCACPVPQPLVSSKQNISSCEDRGGVAGVFSAAAMGAGWYCPNPQALVSSKKVLNNIVTYPVVLDDDNTICPNVTDQQFCERLLVVRDRASRLIGKRINELEIWSREEQARVQMWFGRIDEETRQHLLVGFSRCVTALNNLSSANFVKYTDDFGLSMGCTPATLPNQAAAVCRTDVKNRTIAFTREFCKLEEISGGRDSRLSVLIHEVTHFTDVFGTGDPYYFFYRAKRAAVSDPEGVRNNADSYAGYVVWDTSFLD